MRGAKVVTWAGSLATVGAVTGATVLGLLTGCGADESCEQDYTPPRVIATGDATYELSYLSSDLSMNRIRWENHTTGGSGMATLAIENRCVPFFGCGNWKVVSMGIPLAAGDNTVYVFEQDGGCEWRSDYVITRT